jgi:hypothetical protein
LAHELEQTFFLFFAMLLYLVDNYHVMIKVHLLKEHFLMSLIYAVPSSERAMAVYCPRCSTYIGTLTLREIGELSMAGVEPLCFDCDGKADFIPSQLYYKDDTFLIGLGGLSFLGSWEFGSKTDEPLELAYKPITTKLWYSLKTGDIRVVTLPSLFLSSSPKVIILSSEVVG